MKNIILILTIIVSFFVLTNSSNAQVQCNVCADPPITPICSLQVSVPQCPNCVIWVWFWAYPTCNEYVISHINYSNNDCLNCNEIDIFRAARDKMLTDGPLAPTQNGFQKIQRITSPACYKLQNATTNGYSWQACIPVNACCRSVYTVTYNNGIVTYQQDSNEIIGDLCDGECRIICPE